ncbi:sodium-transporting two-sector ATPase [Candidatus Saccharibacteria bacterium CPR2]|nr:sodium-transporting two-sector ATPase [Candidatus Saccharibacteria bacterium CPR2]
MAEKHFKYLADKGNPIGEVTAVNRFLVQARGLHPINEHALVLFEDGSKGIVRAVAEEYVSILHLGRDSLSVGTGVVLQHHELVTKVGTNFIGRVISVNGAPLDGKGPIAADTVWPVFNVAPPLIGRLQLSDQLETGITLIDSLFPLVLGQRMAMLGDSKSGKSSLMAQLTINQKDTGRVVVYAMIAKRRADVDTLISKLEATGAIKHSIVVVSTMFDSLAVSYLAPYVACAIAEFLWQEKQIDTIVIYDDLSAHAHVHREISLLAEVSPGRDSYPGDMFYSHSSLLERAGRLKSTQKTLTALPLVHTPGGDITAYLPTNIMSITDGQYILDMDLFHEGIRPAISTGLSVSRVGGYGQNDRQKNIAGRVFKHLAKYQQAKEFSHFGSELALEVKDDLEMGKKLFEVFRQGPEEVFSLNAQQLMLEAVLSSDKNTMLDISAMKASVHEVAKKITDDASFKVAYQELLSKSVMEIKR